MLVAGAFAAVEAGRGLGEVGVDTLVLSRFGPDILPMLYIGLGLVGLVASLGYGAALSRSSNERFFPGLLVLLAAILGLEWLIALAGLELIFPLVWISVYGAGLLLLTAIWTVGSFAFDARQGKRLFPLLTSAAIVGSLTGFLAAIVVQRVVGAEALILAEALLFLGAAALLTGLGARIRPRRARGEAAPTMGGALVAGAAYVATSPLMRLVAVAYVLLAILLFSLTFPFMRAMSEAFPGETELLTALAVLSAAVTMASFLVGTLLANRLFARLGLATVALALPIVYVLGFSLWIVRFTLTTAIVVRFAQQVTQRGLSNAAFSAFYNVIPAPRRGQVMAFMDGVPGQVGTMLSGVLLIAATSLAVEQVFVMGLVGAAACAIVLVRARAAYAGSLVATLRAGRAEQVLEGGPGLDALGHDARIVGALRQATTSERPSERALAADILGRLGAAAATSDLQRLATDEDAAIRRIALRSLERIEGSAADARLVEALADDDAGVRSTALSLLRSHASASRITPEARDRLSVDESPRVRGELAIAMADVGATARSGSMVAELLASDAASDRAAGLDAIADIRDDAVAHDALAYVDDTAPSVRAAALRAASAHGLGDARAYVAALDDQSAEVRAAAASSLGSRPDASTVLLEALATGSGRTQDAALDALAGHAEQARAGLLVWAEDEVARASRSRDCATALSSTDPASAAGYLATVISRRERAIESRLLKAVAILGAPEASGLIRRCLHAPDPEVRAQAIEALDTLGDAGLTRGLVRLLERGAEADRGSPSDIPAAANALSDDPDPWVRALALRTLSEHLRDAQHDPAHRVPEDPHEQGRQASTTEPGAHEMDEPLQLVNDVDRMLVLRSVPLFEALDPEDLQRVAIAAVERSWAEGDELMVEGELGDELIAIVEGGVRVVHREDGEEHEIRTYGVGDHIGELAILREAPRAATVVAAAGGVRGLVIKGEAISVLLRERPEAAAAMLATLAERISQQA